MSNYVIPPERVTSAPSGRFGFVLVEDSAAEGGPRVAVTQPNAEGLWLRIGMAWDADQIARHSPTAGLHVAAGEGIFLSPEDTRAFVAFAAARSVERLRRLSQTQ